MTDVHNLIINRDVTLKKIWNVMLCDTLGSLKYHPRRKKIERRELSGLTGSENSRPRVSRVSSCLPSPSPRWTVPEANSLRAQARPWQPGATPGAQQRRWGNSPDKETRRLSWPWPGRASWWRLWLDYLEKAAAANCKPRRAGSSGPPPGRGWPRGFSLLDKPGCRP